MFNCMLLQVSSDVFKHSYCRLVCIEKTIKSVYIINEANHNVLNH